MALTGQIIGTGTVRGSVRAIGSIQGHIKRKASVEGKVVKPIILSGGEVYDGAYVVEPTFDAQTLATKNKTLYNDVTVNAIRVERMSNDSGTTVYIGVKGD